MFEESIEYFFWKTGEKFKRKLSSSHPTEKKTDLICPFDNTHILFSYDNSRGDYSCPNCGIVYTIEAKDQESVNKFAKDYFREIQEEITSLDIEKNNLVGIISHAMEQGLVENNKPNLSEQESKCNYTKSLSELSNRESKDIDRFTKYSENLLKAHQKTNNKPQNP